MAAAGRRRAGIGFGTYVGKVQGRVMWLRASRANEVPARASASRCSKVTMAIVELWICRASRAHPQPLTPGFVHSRIAADFWSWSPVPVGYSPVAEPQGRPFATRASRRLKSSGTRHPAHNCTSHQAPPRALASLADSNPLSLGLPGSPYLTRVPNHALMVLCPASP